MRKNGEVNNSEKVLDENANLVSATDTKSRIIYCNDEFVRYSGFTREELIGQPHNLIRHPDMPQAAFQAMWDVIQSGKSWMGIVKNRSKDGGFYWVNAYVTPLYENGEIIGYESVRTKASSDEIQRAQNAYRKINDNTSPTNFIFEKAPILKMAISQVFIFALAFASYYGVSFIASSQVSVLISILFGSVLSTFIIFKTIKNNLTFSSNLIDDPLAQYIYLNESGIFGRVKFNNTMRQKHLHTVLERLRQLALKVDERTSQTQENFTKTQQLTQSQKQQSSLVEHDSKQLVHGVNSVNDSATGARDATKQTISNIENSNNQLNSSINSLTQLNENISSSDQKVRDLAEDSDEIKNVVQVIRSIAEQTNLLALNAAIEAARAGEQGRGFAVVADEVRNLAQRTQDSTASITQIIEKLTGTTDEAVMAMQLSKEQSESCISQIHQVEDELKLITQQINDIDQKAAMQVDVVHEQTQFINSIDQHAHEINELADSTDEKMMTSIQLADELKELTQNQRKLISGFQR